MRNGVDDRNRGQATRVERTLQFRAEAFNLTNTPWFGAVNSGQFGQVTKLQTNDPRSLQLALRLNF